MKTFLTKTLFLFVMVIGLSLTVFAQKNKDKNKKPPRREPPKIIVPKKTPKPPKNNRGKKKPPGFATFIRAYENKNLS